MIRLNFLQKQFLRSSHLKAFSTSPNSSNLNSTHTDSTRSKDSSTCVEESMNGRQRTFVFDESSGRLQPQWKARDEGVMHSLSFSLKSMFLPTGFPHTTQHSYISHHAWIMSETLFTCTQYVLCHQSMLGALGVAGGDEISAGAAATAGAAAVAMQWVLKDGIGELGKLLVSRYYAHQFDSRPKTWKLIGEALQHVGSLFMIATPFCPSYMFLPLAGIGNAFRAASFMAWGATTALFERHLAKHPSQLADLMAKMESQSVVANLMGMALGVFLLSFSPSASMLGLWYSILMPLGMHSTLRSLRVLQIGTLNHVQLQQLLHGMLLPRRASSFNSSTAFSSIHPAVQSLSSRLPTPLQYHFTQRWFGEWILRVDGALDMWRGHAHPALDASSTTSATSPPQTKSISRWWNNLKTKYNRVQAAWTLPLPSTITIGDSISNAFKTEHELQQCLSMQRDQNYLIWLRRPATTNVRHNKEPLLSIVLHEDAKTQDLVQAFVHAVQIQHRLEPDRLPMPASLLTASLLSVPPQIPASSWWRQLFNGITTPVDAGVWTKSLESHPAAAISWPLDFSSSRIKSDSATWLELVRETKLATEQRLPSILAALEEKGWNIDGLAFPDQGIRSTWPRSSNIIKSTSTSSSTSTISTL